MTETDGPAPEFSGEPVSLDFQDADLRAVLRVFAEVSGLNIVIDPTIQGSVDVALRDVPWDQALDVILRANRLGYSVEGTIVRIAPLTVLAQEEAERAALAEQQALAGELQVRTMALSYARAEDLAPLLSETVLSARGSIQTDVRTNTLIINDLAGQLTQAEALIATLDVPQPQVEIEARIVQTTREFARALGVQWGGDARASNALGNTLPTTFPNQASVGGRTGTTSGPANQQIDGANTVVDLAVEGATTAVGLALGSINGAVNLDAALSALEPRPAPLDAAGHHAEQRRGRDHPGRPDPDPDDREQHGDGLVSGRGAHAAGHAPDHGRQHGDHAHSGRERLAGLQPGSEQHPADRYAAGHHAGARQRRRDHGHRWHLRQPGAGQRRPDAGAEPDSAPGLAVPPQQHLGTEPRAPDFHHAADHEAVGAKAVHVKSFQVIRVTSVLILAAALSGCGDLARQGSSPVQVVVAAPGATPDELGGTLNSDVVTNGSVFNDLGRVTLSLILKDPGRPGITAAPTPLNQATFNRYRVTYQRADGRNTPGADVPHAFDSAFTATVPSTGDVSAGFEIVRHVAKLEAPLAELRNGETLISTIAVVSFYGNDQAGNEVIATGQIGIVFGNFGDPE